MFLFDDGRSGFEMRRVGLWVWVLLVSFSIVYASDVFVDGKVKEALSGGKSVSVVVVLKQVEEVSDTVVGVSEGVRVERGGARERGEGAEEREEAQKREDVRRVLVEVFQMYGFEPAETPIIEYREFVKGDNQNDEAVSDIFKLEDRGKRELALRYEFTFQLKRLMQGKKLPYKRYQIGSVFRDEPVSGNRLRQFTQCDVDIVGAEISDEAEILEIEGQGRRPGIEYGGHPGFAQ